MSEEQIPHVPTDPDDGGNTEVHGGAGESGDEFAEPLAPEEADPEGEGAEDEELVLEPLPEDIEPEVDDEA